MSKRKGSSARKAGGVRLGYKLSSEEQGPCEEIRAVPDRDGLVVTHYLVGSTGWRERLSLRGLRLGLRALRGARRSRGLRVPWEALDVSDPLRPVLRGAKAT
jgi:hypothetical protein